MIYSHFLTIKGAKIYKAFIHNLSVYANNLTQRQSAPLTQG